MTNKEEYTEQPLGKVVLTKEELHYEVLARLVNKANYDSLRVSFETGREQPTVERVEELGKLDLLSAFDIIVGDKGSLKDLGIQFFVRLGAIAIRLYNERNTLMTFKDKARALHDIYVRKNSDYGSSFEDSLDKYGVIAAVVRLQDKVSRYQSLTAEGAIQKVHDEKVEDTLLDMINYCVMTIMYYETRYNCVTERGLLWSTGSLNDSYFEETLNLPLEYALLCDNKNYSLRYFVDGEIIAWGSVRSASVPFIQWTDGVNKYVVNKPELLENGTVWELGYFID